MTEQKVKKRGWVKNAAIIFLSVMLVLTFFSNTIMNHSLPEAAVEYVHSGTIAAKIRGSGTVSANESYEVKGEQTREVLSVPIKVGDKVEVGDTLLLYAEGESNQIKEVEGALDALVLAYQKALINAGDSGDYTVEKREIELAQKALDKAKTDRDANSFSQQELADAKTAANKAKQEYNLQKTKVDNLAEQLAGMSPPQDSGNGPLITQKQNELTAARKTLTAVEKAYEASYKTLKDEAKLWWRFDKNSTGNPPNGELETYTTALAKYLETRLPADGSDLGGDISVPYGSNKIQISQAKLMVEAYNAINTEKTKITSLERELADLQAANSTGDWNYSTVQKQLQDAKNLLSSIESAKTKAEDTLALIEEKKTKYEAADQQVDSSQTALENAMFALEEKRKADGKTGAIEALDLADQKKQIEKKKEELNELRAGGTGALIDSKVNGIITSINITAGNMAEAGQTLMTIEVPDRGYGINIPVTIEQSKNVKVGDVAEVTNNYWGSNITATLVGIKGDPQNPSTGKILYFKLEGDVESGSQLGISIGERGANYESIVPNSAIRTDNNGDFVLVVMTKNSAFSNRYIAQRVDIKVLAKDDVNSAVSGGLSYNDFVITTSTKPIESGMQVRLPD